MKLSPGSVRIAVALFLSFCITGIAPGRSLAFSEADLKAVSFQSGDYEDVLRLQITGFRIPRVSRYGMVNRVVIEFEETVADASLKNLVAGKRGCCVEKFEVQMFQKAADINDSGGVLQKLQNKNTLLVAYVEDGVDVKVNVAGRSIALTFYRIEQSGPQNRPTPINEIENVIFQKDEFAEYLLIQTSKPSAPDLYEAEDPKRLIITFPASFTNPRVENQVFRYMETAGLFSLEALGLGSVPLPYDNIDNAGEFHFVGVPTPFAYTSFVERVKGIQSSDVVFTIYPGRNVDYRIVKRTGNVFELLFVKKIDMVEKSCGLEIAPDSVPGAPYSIQDEHGRSVVYEEEFKAKY